MAHRRQRKDIKKLIVYQIDHLTKHECDCDIDIESGGTCLSCDKEFNSVESWLMHMKEEHSRKFSKLDETYVKMRKIE